MTRIVDEIDGEVVPQARGTFEPRLFAIALEALSARALVWGVTIGAGALWGVTVAHPETLRIITSVGYCVTVLLPVLIVDVKGGR